MFCAVGPAVDERLSQRVLWFHRRSVARWSFCRAGDNRFSVTQRERVVAALAAGDWSEAAVAIADAQNEPPLGAADGSISPEMWEAFAELRRARARFLRARRAFLHAWRLRERVGGWSTTPINAEEEDSDGRDDDLSG